MAVVRTYGCECGAEWEYWHDSGDEGVPPCPTCDGMSGHWIPQRFRMTGSHSKALDVTQGIMERDFGLTDWKDNTRQGETVVKEQVKTKQDIETEIKQDIAVHEAMKSSLNPKMREAADSFFVGSAGGRGAGTPAAIAGDQQMASLAAFGSRQARAEGVSPMELLHKAGKSGKLGPSHTPLNRAPKGRVGW